nr:rod shape-determining protein RodA [Sulfobacillus harzensis]
MIAMYLLAAVSIVVLASASRPWAPSGDPTYFVKRQMIWFGLGTVVLVVATWINYEHFKKFAPYIYWAAIGLLGIVLVHGQSALGAQRWIPIGPFQLQPSELAKVAIIITLATHLDKKKSLKHWRDMVSPLVHVGIPMLMILKQPDLGTTLVFAAITIGMLYMAGLPWLKMLVFPAGLGLMVLWIYLHYRYGIKIPIMHTYQLNRLTAFINPNKDPLGTGYNVIQSRIDIGVGGLTGSGLTMGAHTTLLGYLPESYTDFIYAGIGEQLGFVGSMAILFVYLLIIARAVYIATQAKDRFGMLLAAGVASMFAFHVIESAGMASGIMPVAGVPLPFMSYGGSALMADSAAIGLLLNVYGRRKVQGYKPSVAKPVPVLYSNQLSEQDLVGGPN